MSPLSCAAAYLVLATLMVFPARGFSDEAVPVAAALETDPVPSKGDAADDAAIWLHPEDARLSTIIGTDKDRGLAVYDLSGRELQFLADGKLNNVDLRDDFQLGDRSVALVTAGNKRDGGIAIYKVNPHSRRLEDVAARDVTTVGAYGSCMYHNPIDGKFYYFVNSKAGEVEQWELYDNGAGKVDARKVRSFDVGFVTEGCVADDDLGHLYIGLEEKGIRKYAAEPAAGTDYTVIDRTEASGPLVPEVEGLAIYRAKDHTGYLIASSQGSDDFVIYRREGDNDYVVTIKVVAGNGIDGVTHTDGIEAVNADLGSAFPAGLLVVQDDDNDDGKQNFKLVSWQRIAKALDSFSVFAKFGARR